MPIDFTVFSGLINKLIVEVIDVAETSPEDFGYVSFNPIVVSTINVQIHLQTFDTNSSSWISLPGSATVYDQNGTRDVELTTGNDSLVLQDQLDTNIIRVDIQSVGYESTNIYLTAAQWKGYTNSILSIPLNISAIVTSTDLLLHDSFDLAIPYSLSNGNGIIVDLPTPEKGPAGFIRNWRPGAYGYGATNASFMNITANGLLGSAVELNYSGSANGTSSQDELVYEIGELMNPEEGTVSFFFKPHFDNNDTSAVMAIVDMKNRMDSADNVSQEYVESDTYNKKSLLIKYSGWSSRKYINYSVARFDEIGNVLTKSYDKTPGEYEPDRLLFNAEEWVHIALVYDSDSSSLPGSNTTALFFNGEIVASSSDALSADGEFYKYLILGSKDQVSDLGIEKNYSGASGDFDEVKVFNIAKTNFSDEVAKL